MVEGAGSLGTTNTANLMKSGIELTDKMATRQVACPKHSLALDANLLPQPIVACDFDHGKGGWQPEGGWRVGSAKLRHTDLRLRHREQWDRWAWDSAWLSNARWRGDESEEGVEEKG